MLLVVTPYVSGPVLEVLGLRLYLYALALLFFTPLCCYGDGEEGSREDSPKGKMKLSHEDRWLWLGISPGELMLSRTLTCAFHQEVLQGDERSLCLGKVLRKEEIKRNNC